MRAYTNPGTSTPPAAGYPGAIHTVTPFWDERLDYAQRTETATIPASGNLILDHAPREALTLTLTASTAGALALQPYEISPSPTIASLDLDTGRIRIHTSLAGQTLTAVYTPQYTPLLAQHLHTHAAEIAATQTYLTATRALVDRATRLFGPYTVPLHTLGSTNTITGAEIDPGKRAIVTSVIILQPTANGVQTTNADIDLRLAGFGTSIMGPQTVLANGGQAWRHVLQSTMIVVPEATTLELHRIATQSGTTAATVFLEAVIL